MLRSRLLAVVEQVLLQRTIVTNVKTVMNSDGNNDEQRENLPDENQSTHTSVDPPRRPLTQQFTHQVTNQVPPLEFIDLYESDLAFQEFAPKEKIGSMRELAAEVGTFHWFEQGQRANRHTPSLHQFDRYGQRIDEVQFHPSYHDLMQLGMRHGVSN